MYIYEIQAFAYSDFEHYIIGHTNKYTPTEFQEMVEKAAAKVKLKRNMWDYPNHVLTILKNDYGFVELDYPVCHIGCGSGDKVICQSSL